VLLDGGLAHEQPRGDLAHRRRLGERQARDRDARPAKLDHVTTPKQMVDIFSAIHGYRSLRARRFDNRSIFFIVELSGFRRPKVTDPFSKKETQQIPNRHTREYLDPVISICVAAGTPDANQTKSEQGPFISMETATNAVQVVPLVLKTPISSSAKLHAGGPRRTPFGEPPRLRAAPERPRTPAAADAATPPARPISRAMSDVFAVIERLAATDVTVTLIGETGTGKDVFAHVVHDESPRAGRPFVVFDCGAVPPNLIESELFGHERGSFTGAHAEHAGAFERAAGGTLFLDEIGELPIELQPRLLRVLDNRLVRRVGGTRDRQVDVRIVAATNRDLGALVATRQFRQDLYFRLAAAIVNLPPLRERLDDLPYLIARLLGELGRGEVTVTPETLKMLSAHPWPGNVRELKNALACAIAFVDFGLLEPRHLRFVEPSGEHALLDRLPLAGHSLGNIERAAIKQTLQQVGGNKVHAARALGIAPSTLYEKLKKYDL
jgi:transcriptional regulator of acetoin/glycerol metabolism